MGLDVTFNSRCLGRCLGFGWYADIILFHFLGDASFMLEGYLVMDVDVIRAWLSSRVL